jgi:hypothetical protein
MLGRNMMVPSSRQKQPPETNSATLKMEAVCSSEISEQTHYTTRCKNPQGHYINNIHCKNQKT